jgi:TPR repeat protein
MNYLTGSKGFMINEGKAARMFEKMYDISLISRINLGFLYLNGRGVEKNFMKARMIFEREANTNINAREIVIIMKYYGLGYSNESKNSIKVMTDYFKRYVEEKKFYNTKNNNTANNSNEEGNLQGKGKEKSRDEEHYMRQLNNFEYKS